MPIAAAIALIERQLAATVCFHDYASRLAPLVGGTRLLHRNRVCQLVKRGQGAVCAATDVGGCRAALAGAPQGFLKACHAGLVEAYAPVRDGEGLAGAVYIGPWAWTGRRLPDEVLVPGAPPAPPPAGAAPLQDPQVLADALVLARLLAALVERSLAGPPAADGDGQRIRDFAALNLPRSPGLADLADHLGVAPRSASRLVRRHCGCTWPALVNRLRLEKAQRLLAATGLEVREVARRCGLGDHRQLDALFQRAHGCTPSAWRSRLPG